MQEKTARVKSVSSKTAVAANELMCMTEKELKSRVATAQCSNDHTGKSRTSSCLGSRRRKPSRECLVMAARTVWFCKTRSQRALILLPAIYPGVLQGQSPAHCHSPESRRRMQEPASSAHSHSVPRCSPICEITSKFQVYFYYSKVVSAPDR